MVQNTCIDIRLTPIFYWLIYLCMAWKSSLYEFINWLPKKKEKKRWGKFYLWFETKLVLCASLLYFTKENFLFELPVPFRHLISVLHTCNWVGTIHTESLVVLLILYYKWWMFLLLRSRAYSRWYKNIGKIQTKPKKLSRVFTRQHIRCNA